MDRKKYIAKRESREARRNRADAAAVVAAAAVALAAGKSNADHTYFMYNKCVEYNQDICYFLFYIRYQIYIF